MDIPIKSRQLLLTTINGTFTGRLLTLDWAAAAAKDAESNLGKNAGSPASTLSTPAAIATAAAAASSTNRADELKNGASTRKLLEDIDINDDESGFQLSLPQTASTNNSAMAIQESEKNTQVAGSSQNRPVDEAVATRTLSGAEYARIPADTQRDREQREALKSLPLVHPPLCVMIGDLFDLPEPSFDHFSRHLLRLAIVSHVLIPHVRGFEVSSVQKKSLSFQTRTGYDVAELAADVLSWIDDVILQRQLVPAAAGVVLVSHGVVGGLVAEAVNALFWGRREAVLQRAHQTGASMSGFWTSSSASASFSASPTDGAASASSSHSSENEHQRNTVESLIAAKVMLIRGIIFLNSAPVANVVHSISSRQIMSAAVAAVAARDFRLFLRHLHVALRVVCLSVWCHLAWWLPVVFVNWRIDRIVSAWWIRAAFADSSPSTSSSPSATQQRVHASSAAVVRHFHLGGTERSEFGKSLQKHVYQSSILRSTTSRVGICTNALAATVSALAGFFCGGSADMAEFLHHAAERRASYSKQQRDLEEQEEKKRKKQQEQEQQTNPSDPSGSSSNTERNSRRKAAATKNGSLLLLSQLPKLRVDAAPRWDAIAAAVPTLSIMSSDHIGVALAPLGLPKSVMESALEELGLMATEQQPVAADKQQQQPEQRGSKRAVTLCAPSSAASLVTIHGVAAEDAFWLHRPSGEQNDADPSSSSSFLCALAAAKFLRRGMLFERVQLGAAAAAQSSSSAPERENDSKPKPRKLK